MSVSSSPELLVLLALRLTGLAEVDDLATTTGLSAATVASVIAEAEHRGDARHRAGSFHGYALTPRGRERSAALLGDELATHRMRPAAEDAYQRFLAVNPELLELCTAWQLRDHGGQPTVNGVLVDLTLHHRQLYPEVRHPASFEHQNLLSSQVKRMPQRLRFRDRYRRDRIRVQRSR